MTNRVTTSPMTQPNAINHLRTHRRDGQLCQPKSARYWTEKVKPGRITPGGRGETRTATVPNQKKFKFSCSFCGNSFRAYRLRLKHGAFCKEPVRIDESGMP